MLKENHDANSLYHEGKRALEMGDLETAVEKFKQAINISPHFKTLELLGESLLLKGEALQAIVYLAAAAGLGKNQFRARFLLAKALLIIGDKAHAVDKLKEALMLNSNYKSAKILLDTLSADAEE